MATGSSSPPTTENMNNKSNKKYNKGGNIAQKKN